MAEVFNPLGRTAGAPSWWRSGKRHSFYEVVMLLTYDRLNELASHG